MSARVLLASWGLLGLLIYAMPASAQSGPDTKLLEERPRKRWACALDVPLDEQLAGIECLLENGELIRAWQELARLRGEARAKGEDAISRAAQRRLKRLELRVGVLELVFSSLSDLPGLTLWIDGKQLREEQMRGPIALLPGEHVALFRAPGHKAARVVFEVRAGQVGRRMRVPVLQRLTPEERRALAAVAPTLPLAPPPAPDPAANQGLFYATTAMTGIFATATVAASVAAGFLRADEREARSDDDAPPGKAGALGDAASELQVVGAVFGAATIISGGVSLFLFLRRDDGSERTPRVGGWWAPGGVGLTLQGEL